MSTDFEDLKLRIALSEVVDDGTRVLIGATFGWTKTVGICRKAQRSDLAYDVVISSQVHLCASIQLN